MSGRRVVISGMGLISPVGHDKDELWNNLLAGKSGIKLIDRFDTTGFSTRIAAQVENFNAQDYVSRAEARRMDRFVQYACAAARIALEDANLQIEKEKQNRVGVWVGSGIGGIETFEKQFLAMQKKGVGGLSPFFIPMMIPNMASGQISIMFGCKGPNGCTVTACASASHSIGEAFEIIRKGKADLMFTGGAEAAITPLGVGGFCAMKATSSRNDEPQKACRPFDLDRDGFVMGEGSGILVLEEMEHALERGAKVYAEIIGYGCSADALHMVQPDSEGNGAAMAFQMAINDAGIKAEEVDYINAHGTGTPLNDLMESRAIKKVFGDHSKQLLVSSIKASTGHMLGAAGAVELIASTLSLVNNKVPHTVNLETPDPECNLDYVPGQPREKDLQVVMSDSLGFGGHNAALIIRKFK